VGYKRKNFIKYVNKIQQSNIEKRIDKVKNLEKFGELINHETAWLL